jgi:hypothetical protein
MAMSGSVTDGCDGDCGGRFGVVIVYESIVRLTEGESRVSFSLRKPGSAPPPSSAAGSGAGVGPGEELGEAGTVIEQ